LPRNRSKASKKRSTKSASSTKRKTLPKATEAKSSSVLRDNRHDSTLISISKVDPTEPSNRNKSRNEGKKSQKLERNWVAEKIVDQMYLNLGVIVLDLNNMQLRGEIRRCFYDDATNTPMYKIFIGSKFVIVLSYSNLLKLKEGTLSANYV
jgi:hypothetical protein